MRRSVVILLAVGLTVAGMVAPAGGADGDMSVAESWDTWDDPPQLMTGTADVAVDIRGRVYVPNEGGGAIRVFDGHGAYLSSIEGVAAPHGLAIDDANGRLFVISQGASAVQVFDLLTGALLTEWSSWIEVGSPNTFNLPMYGAVDAAGNLYVTDFNGEIITFTHDGTWLGSFGTSATVPVGIAIAADPATGEDEVFVAVPEEHKIDVYSTDGTWLRSWGSEGTAAGQFTRARGVAVAGGVVYVADEISRRVQSFDPDGTFRAEATDTSLLRLDNIATDGKGNVYTADQSTGTVTRYVEYGAAPTCGGLVPSVLGTAGGDELEGTTGDDVIVGLAGPDTIVAGRGNDTICAGPGHDRVSGEPGRDMVYGGPGRDKLRGNRGRDELYGGAQGDRIFGNARTDRLFGQKGDDFLVGGPGVDSIVGGAGTDRCWAEPGEAVKTCER